MKRVPPLVPALLLTIATSLQTVHGATALHHYDFNGSGVTDLIGAANGTLYNGATVSGGALTLDGIDDCVEFGEFIIPTQLAGSWPGNSVSVMAQELEPTSGFGNILSHGWGLGRHSLLLDPAETGTLCGSSRTRHEVVATRITACAGDKTLPRPSWRWS